MSASGNVRRISSLQTHHTWCIRLQQICGQWQMKVLISHNQAVISCCQNILAKQKDPMLEERSYHGINGQNWKTIWLLPHQLMQNGKSVLAHNQYSYFPTVWSLCVFAYSVFNAFSAELLKSHGHCNWISSLSSVFINYSNKWGDITPKASM